MHDQFPDVRDAAELVELHVGIENAAAELVEDSLFPERPGDAHDQRAVDLALGLLEADDQAAVLDRDHLVHRNDAGLDVDRNIGDLYAADARVVELAAVAIRLLAHLGDGRAGELLASVGPGNRLRGVALGHQPAVFGDDVVDVDAQTRSNLLLKLLKRIRRLALKGEVQALGTLTVEVFIDYDETTVKQTLRFDMTSARFKNWLDHPVNLRCRAIKFKLKNAELDTPVQVDGAVVYFQNLGPQK